jgi:hypothetical protein
MVLSAPWAILIGVPDNDFIPRGVRGAWRKPYRAIIDGEDPAVIGSLLTQAVAGFLRENPCSGTATLALELHESAAADDGQRLRRAIEAFYDQAGRSPMARRYAEEAEVLFSVERLSVAATTDDQVVTMLGRQVMERLADAFLFSRSRDLLMERRFETLSDEREFERSCQQAAEYEVLAARQAQHPDGVGLRAPSRRRRTIAEILDQEVE